jgi:hypothetical protein
MGADLVICSQPAIAQVTRSAGSGAKNKALAVFRVSEPMCEDEIVQLRFSLPGCRKRIQARGEVAWADRDGNMVFKFIGMSQGCATALAQWLERQLLA